MTERAWVPPEVNLAIMTNRAQLLAPLKARVKSGEQQLSTGEVLGLLSVIEEAMELREEHRKLQDETARLMTALTDNLKGVHTMSARLLEMVREGKVTQEDDNG